MKAKPEHNSLMVPPPGVEITATGLRIKTRLSYSQWSGLLKGLQRVHRSILWLIGDAIVWGEDHLGEEFSQAISEYSRGAQYNAAWVSRQIEISRRREILSWSHHAEVAMLDRAEQDRFLQEAIDHHWGVHELRGAVRLFRNPPPKLDWHEPVDGPEVVPEDPEFPAMNDVRPSRFYPEIAETIGDGRPARPMDLEVQYNRIVGIVRAFRAAEKQGNGVEVTRLKTAMDFFLAEVDRREERTA